MAENSSFTISCPKCGQHLEAEPDMVGQVFPCPTCGAEVTVTQPTPTPAVPRIVVVRKRKGFLARNRAWLLPVAIALILLGGYFLLGDKVKSWTSSTRPSTREPSRPASSYTRPSTSSRTSRGSDRPTFRSSGTFSGPRKFVKEHIAKNNNCRIVAITQTGGDVVVCGRNNWAASSCPRSLNNALQAITDKGDRIIDVCLTERGRYVVLYGTNAASWSDIPEDMEYTLRHFNSNGEELYSATFNDAGDWIAVSEEHYNCSATWLKEWLSEGNKKFGILRAAAVSTDAAVAVYDEGFRFFGNVPEELKQALREADFDVRIVKMAGSAWFFASRDGSFYRASM